MDKPWDVESNLLVDETSANYGLVAPELQGGHKDCVSISSLALSETITRNDDRNYK